MSKVLFGFSDLYVGTYTVAADGTVTMGTPYHQPGAVGFSPEEQGDQSTFYADNIAYFTEWASGAIEGDLVVAKFDDEFKTQFLGYAETNDGGLAKVKNASKPAVYMAFEVQTDTDPIRMIFYNGTLGSIVREYATIEENREVQTESLATSFVGDNKTGIQCASYKKGDTGYATLFTQPAAPALKSA